MRDISTLELANSMIYALLKQERGKIAGLLRKEKLGLKVTLHSGTNSHFNVFSGRGKSINDYRNYLWISVVDQQKETSYWITMFYNDVDGNSGNVHTQFGRIQFWKVDMNQRNRISPNKIIKAKNGSFEIGIDMRKSEDPHLWIDSPAYCAHEVVNQFLKWKANEENGGKLNEKFN